MTVEDRRWVGDSSQHFSARRVVFDDGSERGVRAIEVDVFGGVRSTILLDRGMDLAQTWVAGVPLAWMSPTGPVNPALLDGRWLRGFPGGLLTTCGLGNVGPEQSDGGESYNMHGRASWLAARNVVTAVVEADGEFWLEITGDMNETAVYGSDLHLRRRWRFSLERAVLAIRDEVTNRGWRPEPLLVLYHVNLGFPLVSPTARLLLPPHTTHPRDDVAAHALAQHESFTAPAANANAEVFEHRLLEAAPWSSAGIVNSDSGDNVGLVLRWKPEQLPRLWHWRMLGQGMYLTGIEPANCGVAGRHEERLLDDVDILGVGQQRVFDLSFHAAADAVGVERLLELHERSGIKEGEL